MRLLAFVAAAALFGGANAAHAADDWTMGADLRCVVAFGALVSNPTYRDAASSGIFYFVGRLEGRDPTFDLAGGLKKMRSVMQPNQYASEAERCGAELKAKNELLKTMSPAPAAQHRGVG